MRTSKRFDIVGIGAINLDYVATRERMLRLEPDLVEELSARFEHGTETPVHDASEIDALISQIGKATLVPFLGGSSYNVMHAAAKTNRRLRLAYVGIAGKSDDPNIDAIEQLQQLGIDTTFVRRYPAERSGICLSTSAISDGERSLLTFPGANIHMATHIRENFDALTHLLEASRLAHVTSFFDDKTPQALVDLISHVKDANPSFRVSFDPGHHWCKEPPQPVMDLIGMSDLLFLSYKEFRNLGGHVIGKRDIDVARSIFDVCADDACLIVVKTYEFVMLYYKIGAELVARQYAVDVLPVESIEDATGAGDVFAAGFMTAIIEPGLEKSDGVDLGLRLVRRKLRTAGTFAYDGFGADFTQFVSDLVSAQETQKPTRNASQKDRDFIAEVVGVLVEAMKVNLDSMKLDRAKKSELTARIDDLEEALFDSPANEEKIKRALGSAKRVTEGVAGNVVAQGIMRVIAQALKHLDW